MIKHVVMWKFLDSVTESDQVEMRNQLLALKETVPFLVDISVGTRLMAGGW